MLRKKSSKNVGGLPISVDSRGGPIDTSGHDNFEDYDQRSSARDSINGRDSMFETAMKREWLPKKDICKILESAKYQLCTLVLVFYSLFACNIAIMAHAPPSADPWLDAFLILCIVVFAAEIILTIICYPRPPWGLLILDTIATLSIVVDLSWVTEAASLDETNGSRTSQAAVMSARAGRVVRLVRLLRLLRTVSLLSKFAKDALQRQKALDAAANGTGTVSNIGGKLTDALVTQVAVVVIIMVITTALLTSWGVQPSPFDVYVSALGARAGATREELQPQVDEMLQFGRDHVSKQKPLTLRVGTVEWNWVEEAGGWPAQSSAAAEFGSDSGDNPPAMLVVDVSDQDAQDAMLDTILIIIVLVILLFYVLLLNYTIYKTLVRPLERIFNIIRTNAAQVVAALGNNEAHAGHDDVGDADEDGDIGTIEAAVVKMSRILAHHSTPGRQGTHVARALAADADDKTKQWLATMVGEGLQENEGESSAAAADGAVKGEDPVAVATPASPTSPTTAAGNFGNLMSNVKNVRFSMFSGSSSNAAAAAAAAAAASLPANRSSGASLAPSTDSRANTGSFGGLALDGNNEALAAMAAFGSNLSAAQKDALLTVDLELLHSYKFDVLEVPKEALTAHIVTMFIQLGLAHFSQSPPGDSSAVSGSPATPSAAPQQQQRQGFVDVALLWKFVDELSSFYHNVPYHNFYHCVDVTHSTFLLLDRLRAPACLTPVECYALMIAALAHDMDHPGVNNAYLVNVRDSLALAYNDASVLENRHVACLYALVTERPDIDVFKELDAATWKEVRRIVIAAILHTDMTQHFPMVSKLEVFLELKAADIQAAHAAQRNALRSQNTGNVTTNNTSAFAMSASTVAYLGAKQLPSVFTTAEERPMLLCAILHCADISNPARPAYIAEKWAGRVLSEFFAQGDRERNAGQPISPMCDRATTSRAGSQINFIEFVVIPLFSLVARIFPDAGELLENTAASRDFWQAALIQELNSDSKKAFDEKTTEIQKAEGRMGAFNEKYKDHLALVAKRKRDLRRRFHNLPPSSGSNSIIDFSGHPLYNRGSVNYIPMISESPRGSVSTSASRKDSGAGVSPSASSAASLASDQQPQHGPQGGSGTDMSRAAEALFKRGRSISGRGPALGIPNLFGGGGGGDGGSSDTNQKSDGADMV